ncbi:MAG TPA: Gfo/Idh/MocA family oxidoreductase [Opitutales bacterium]|jgi:predicted dehydrogenase|nr:Gfo/Idh/MocA family oxidoreductase [Opitutales bacterium]
MLPCAVDLVGCGALAESVYAPVLVHLERAGRARVVALVDPNPARCAQLAKVFPEAKSLVQVEDLPTENHNLAIIASPPGVHAAQTCALLASGRHVLCEKPLTTSLTEAEKMIAAAKSANRLLAAGMMRRFYSPVQALREYLTADFLGDPIKVEIAEGGRFGWNAASPKFFEPENGGVLFDLGSHVLDLLCHFFGGPNTNESFSDALGGTHTNCLLTARWPSGLQARVRLSWDTPLKAGWRVVGSRGECRWDGSADGQLLIKYQEAKWWLHAQPRPALQPSTTSGWTAAFVRQIENVLSAMEDREKLLTPAEDVLPTMRWLETAQNTAKLLPQAWLSAEEQVGAIQAFHS